MSRQILVLDSSQIASMGECNQYWNLKYNENLTSSNEIREDMAQGTYGHKLLELLLYKYRAWSKDRRCLA